MTPVQFGRALKGAQRRDYAMLYPQALTAAWLLNFGKEKGAKPVTLDQILGPSPFEAAKPDAPVLTKEERYAAALARMEIMGEKVRAKRRAEEAAAS